MQRVMPRLMLAQRGSGAPQSQHASFPGTARICSIRLQQAQVTMTGKVTTCQGPGSAPFDGIRVKQAQRVVRGGLKDVREGGGSGEGRGRWEGEGKSCVGRGGGAKCVLCAVNKSATQDRTEEDNFSSATGEPEAQQSERIRVVRARIQLELPAKKTRKDT